MIKLTPENQKNMLRVGYNYRFSDDESYLYELVHTHDFFEYYIIASGKILHICNEVHSILSKGDVLLIRPSEVHNMGRIPGERFEMLNICVTKQEMQRVFDHYGAQIAESILSAPDPPTVTLNNDELQRLVSRHQLLAFEFNNLSADLVKLNMNMRFLLSEVMSCFLFAAGNDNNDSRKWLDRVLQIMNSPVNINRGMEALIELSGFSQGHLCRLMKACYGITPGAYIVDLRLSYAADLLRGTELSVNEIARQVGYYSLSHFLKSFKERFGTTPLKYSRLPGADKQSTPEDAITEEDS